MILITNAKLFTRDESNPFIDGGAIAIEGTKILEVGTTKALLEKYKNAQIKDAKNRIVMPGFINTHMHYYSTFARGMFLDSPPATMFSQVLKNLWWRLDKALDINDVYYSAIAPMIDQVRNGVTTSIDHHASPNAVSGSLFKIAEAAKLVGIRSNLCYEISDRDGEAIRDAGIQESVDFIKQCQKDDDDMMGGLFGFHASMTINDDTLSKSIAAANSLGAGFHIHCAEGIEDVADSLAKYNMRVVERFYKAGVLNKKSLAIHCIHVSPEEIDMLAKSGVAVVHNSESNMGNAVGVSPVLEMMQKNVLVGMGTDGYTSDMTESLKVANLIHKHAKQLPSVAWVEPPTMLFQNNAKILERQIKSPVGILKQGALADVIIVDYLPTTPLNENTINSHILFGICGKNVDTTIINGKIVMDERVLVNIDEKQIMHKCVEVAEKFWKKV